MLEIDPIRETGVQAGLADAVGTRADAAPTNVRETGVAFIGAVMVDEVCQVAALPQSGGCSVVESRHVALGGCAFNSANIARQLGAPCLLFAPVGKGLYANHVREELACRDLRAIEVETETDCGACICLVEPDGERTMITTPGIERQFQDAWFADFDELWRRQCGAVDCGIAVVSGFEIDGSGGDAILSFLESRPDIDFWYAPGPCLMRVAPEKVARIKAMGALWHLNDKEVFEWTGLGDVTEAGAALARECGGTVVITEGAKGSHAFVFDEKAESCECLFAPTKAVRPVDTIGAGDAHVGALAAARAAGYEWKAALDLANRCAGVVCQVQGATLADREATTLGVTSLF